MGEGSAVQAAIAWIQETAPGTTQGQTHTGTLSRADDYYYTRGASGGSRQRHFQQYDPATILKVPHGQKYLPGPLGAQHAPSFVTSAEAIFRTVALRWNLPEHLVTGSAANNNFASSLVAETPFVKYAESQQQFYARRDRKTLWQVLKFGWQAGRFGNVPWAFIKRSLDITVTPPQIEVRDPEKETKVRQMLHAAGILSRKTWSAQESLDFDQEQKNLKQEEAEADRAQGEAGPKGDRGATSNAPAAPSNSEPHEFGPASESAFTDVQPAEALGTADSLEGPWNPLLHPRGGYPQNRGWFSRLWGNAVRAVRRRLGRSRSAPTPGASSRTAAGGSKPAPLQPAAKGAPASGARGSAAIHPAGFTKSQATGDSAGQGLGDKAGTDETWHRPGPDGKLVPVERHRNLERIEREINGKTWVFFKKDGEWWGVPKKRQPIYDANGNQIGYGVNLTGAVKQTGIVAWTLDHPSDAGWAAIAQQYGNLLPIDPEQLKEDLNKEGGPVGPVARYLGAALAATLLGGAIEKGIGKAIGKAVGKLLKKLEDHHQLPKEFIDLFKSKGLEIEDYVIKIDRAAHRLKPDGLHTGKGVQNWNGAWRAFFDEYPDASKEQMLEQLAKMRKDFGLE
jgi:hypothetical protein